MGHLPILSNWSWATTNSNWYYSLNCMKWTSSDLFLSLYLTHRHTHTHNMSSYSMTESAFFAVNWFFSASRIDFASFCGWYSDYFVLSYSGEICVVVCGVPKPKRKTPQWIIFMEMYSCVQILHAYISLDAMKTKFPIIQHDCNAVAFISYAFGPMQCHSNRIKRSTRSRQTQLYQQQQMPTTIANKPKIIKKNVKTKYSVHANLWNLSTLKIYLYSVFNVSNVTLAM